MEGWSTPGVKGIKGVSKTPAEKSGEKKCIKTTTKLGRPKYVCGEQRATAETGLFTRPGQETTERVEAVKKIAPEQVLYPKQQRELAGKVAHPSLLIKEPQEAKPKTPDTVHFEEDQESKWKTPQTKQFSDPQEATKSSKLELMGKSQVYDDSCYLDESLFKGLMFSPSSKRKYDLGMDAAADPTHAPSSVMEQIVTSLGTLANTLGHGFVNQFQNDPVGTLLAAGMILYPEPTTTAAGAKALIARMVGSKLAKKTLSEGVKMTPGLYKELAAATNKHLVKEFKRRSPGANKALQASMRKEVPKVAKKLKRNWREPAAFAAAAATAIGAAGIGRRLEKERKRSASSGELGDSPRKDAPSPKTKEWKKPEEVPSTDKPPHSIAEVGSGGQGIPPSSSAPPPPPPPDDTPPPKRLRPKKRPSPKKKPGSKKGPSPKKGPRGARKPNLLWAAAGGEEAPQRRRGGSSRGTRSGGSAKKHSVAPAKPMASKARSSKMKERAMRGTERKTKAPVKLADRYKKERKLIQWDQLLAATKAGKGKKKKRPVEELDVKRNRVSKSLSQSDMVKSMSYLKPVADQVLSNKMSFKAALDKVPWWMQDDLISYLQSHKNKNKR